MSAVELRAIWKSYGGPPVVRGLDLHLAAGEIFTLLGPSGCGKTTTLRMIAGLERPEQGEIWIGGEQVAGQGRYVEPEHRRLGMVFQSYAVWPHRSVLENVAYPLRLQGRPEAADRARAALADVQLQGLEQRYPHQLSGGQQQRVALARALVAEPRVLLLDEPLSNLDAGLREQMRLLIARLARSRGLTVVLVTHDQEEALSISDRIGVMVGGKLAQVADPRTLYGAPATRFVARFVGTLNSLPAERRGGRVEPGGLLDPGPDGPVEIGFRPEQVRFAPTGLPATLLSRSFRGPSTRYEVQVSGRELLIDAQGEPGPCIQLDGAFVLRDEEPAAPSR
jgi:iron(III) transport system ATP-binding protein